jgi:hypothetical protein
MDEQTKSMTVAIVSFLISLSFSVWFLVYLTNLEKKDCKCALTWHRQALIAFICITLLCVLLNTFLPTLNPIVGVISGITSLLYMIISLVYIYYLKNSKCDCSKDPARTTIEVFSWISVSMTGLSLLLLGFALIFARKR